MSKQKSKFIKTLILCLVLIGFLTPFYFVKAQFGFEIITAPSVWAMQTLAKIYVGIFVSFYAFKASLAILKWVVSPEFLQIPGGYTHNIFVLEGWRIVRDLVNMLFILVVIAIGIGIALRAREYEIKKTVPRLIAMALLINFSPLICGVIIDASNILMNFFLGAGAGGFDELGRMLEGPLKTLAGTLRSVIEGVLSFDWEKIAWGLCFKPIMALAFNVFATLVILILAALFLARYLLLWLLTILSPLAFFCNILPQTKRVWRMWWQQFIQWCFIGIGASFFLYLAQRMIALRSSLWKQVPQQDIGLPGNIFLALIPLSFLAAGYFATTYFAPMGAKQIIGLVERGVKWPMTTKGKRRIKALWQRVREKTAGEISRTGRRPKVSTRLAKLKEAGKKWGEVGKEKGGIRGTLQRVAGWGLRKMAELPEAATVTYPQAQYSQWEEKGSKVQDEKTFRDELYAWRKERRNKARLVGLIAGAIKSGKLKDFIKAGVVSPKTIEDAFRWSHRYKLKEAQKALTKYFSADEDMLRRFAQVLDQETAHLPEGHKDRTSGGLTAIDRKAGYKDYVEKIRASTLKTRKDFEDFWDRIEDLPEEKQAEAKRRAVEQITEILHKGLLSREQLTHAGRVMGGEFISVIERELEHPEKLYQIHPQTGKFAGWIVKWAATSPAARELGVMVPQEFMNEARRRKYELASTQATKLYREFNLEKPTQGLTNLYRKIKEYEEEAKQAANTGNLEEAEVLRRQAEILRSALPAIEEKSMRAIEKLNLEQLGKIREDLNTALTRFSEEKDVRQSIEKILSEISDVINRLRGS